MGRLRGGEERGEEERGRVNEETNLNKRSRGREGGAGVRAAGSGEEMSGEARMGEVFAARFGRGKRARQRGREVCARWRRGARAVERERGVGGTVVCVQCVV